MKLWILNHYAVAPGGSGGTRHFDLSKELTRKGHEVSIFASSFNHQSRIECEFLTGHVKTSMEKTYDGVKFTWIKTIGYTKNDWRRVFNILQYSFRVYQDGMKRNERPDVIIGSLMHPLAAFVGYLLAKKKKCLFYFEERDLWPQSLIDLGKVSKRHPLVWILSKFEMFLYKKSNKIIVLFDKAVDYVKSRGIQSDKVMYLSNGVDLNRYEIENQTLPSEHQEILDGMSDKFIAVYIGSHGISDHLNSLLDAASILNATQNKIHFLFVGDGPEKKGLLDRAKKEKLANVTFANPISKEAIPVLLKRADVGLMALHDAPIYKWGISFNKMYDYMGARLPIVFLNEMRDIMYSESQGVVEVKDSKGMAEAICELQENPDQVNQLGVMGRLRAEREFSWEILSDLLSQTLMDDLEKKKL